MTRCFRDVPNGYVLDAGSLPSNWIGMYKGEHEKHLEITVGNADEGHSARVLIDKHQAYILSVKLREYARTSSFSRGNPRVIPWLGGHMLVSNLELGVDVEIPDTYTPTCGKPSTAPRKRKARTPSTRKCTMAKKPAPKKPAPKGGKKTAC
jgi:hypothetical protein